MRVVLHVPVVTLYFCLPIRVFVQPPTSFDLISLFDVKSPFNLKLHSIKNLHLVENLIRKKTFDQKLSIPSKTKSSKK